MTGLARAAAVAVMLALPAPALAHSLLLEATPAANAVTSGSPARVDLRFNNRIEKRLSAVAVIGPDGTRHAAEMLDEGGPDRLRAAVPPLPPGAYRLEWRVLSTDGHVVTGSYPFRIAR